MVSLCVVYLISVLACQHAGEFDRGSPMSYQCGGRGERDEGMGRQAFSTAVSSQPGGLCGDVKLKRFHRLTNDLHHMQQRFLW